MRKLIACLYIGEDVAWLDFKVPPCIVIPITSFDNGRPAIDQTGDDIKQELTGICQFFLEREYGLFTPLGVEIDEEFDREYNTNEYRLYINRDLEKLNKT